MLATGGVGEHLGFLRETGGRGHCLLHVFLYHVFANRAHHMFLRLVRDGRVVYQGKISSLRRFKDDVKEVAQGYECGIGIENYNDIKVGDVIEAFVEDQVARQLQ